MCYFYPSSLRTFPAAISIYESEVMSQLRALRGLKSSQAHPKRFEFALEIPFDWGYDDPYTGSAHHSGGVSVGISDHWLVRHKVQERVDVRHYVICTTDSCPLMMKLSKSSESSSCSWSSCATKITTVDVSVLWNFSCKNFQVIAPCRHLSPTHFSSAWAFLHLESLPDGSTNCSVSPRCLQLPSFTHPSSPSGSSSHHCLPHWLVVSVVNIPIISARKST